ncbi:hypothetical protein [Kocuria rosea]|uniref:uridine kinase family protein n=1 Tax=Kocuria TaxID=57493 RepID=UPI003018318F
MSPPLVLPPEEPEAGPWSAVRIEDVAALLLEGLEHAPGRPWIVAVDGRGGAGKSTLAQLLLPHLAPAAVVHTDDVAWHEPFFGWGHLLAHDILEPLHQGLAVSFRPPAWPAHGRQGTIEIPAGLRAVIIEGTGADQRRFAEQIDRRIWVQADHQLAEERGIVRDVAHGTNGDAGQSRRFWHEWMAHELPYFVQERPWSRADLIVAGTPVLSLGENELACAPGPRRTSPSYP